MQAIDTISLVADAVPEAPSKEPAPPKSFAEVIASDSKATDSKRTDSEEGIVEDEDATNEEDVSSDTLPIHANTDERDIHVKVQLSASGNSVANLGDAEVVESDQGSIAGDRSKQGAVAEVLGPPSGSTDAISPQSQDGSITEHETVNPQSVEQLNAEVEGQVEETDSEGEGPTLVDTETGSDLQQDSSGQSNREETHQMAHGFELQDPDPLSSATQNEVVSFDRSSGVAADLAANRLATNTTASQANALLQEASTANSTAIADGGSHVGPVEQATLAIKNLVESGSVNSLRSVSLELSPAELGHLAIRIEQTGDAITAHIVATEHASSDLLQNQKQTLEESLADLGYENASVDISHREGGQSDSEHGSEQQGQNRSTSTDAGQSASLRVQAKTSIGLNIVA